MESKSNLQWKKKPFFKNFDSLLKQLDIVSSHLYRDLFAELGARGKNIHKRKEEGVGLGWSVLRHMHFGNVWGVIPVNNYNLK